jgi:hypothetical protein
MPTSVEAAENLDEVVEIGAVPGRAPQGTTRRQELAGNVVR